MDSEDPDPTRDGEKPAVRELGDIHVKSIKGDGSASGKTGNEGGGRGGAARG